MRCGVLRADRVVVNKAKREMLLLRGKRVLRNYRLWLGRDPVGHKQPEGDGGTPAGHYIIIDRRNPRRRSYLGLHLFYPNQGDIERAGELGISRGGEIRIDRLKDRIAREGDWTQGCIPVTDREMDEIRALVAEGTPIVINP